MGLRPTEGDEKRLVPATLSMESLLFPCHPDRSEAERRDLRFRGPVVEMFFGRAKRIGEICGLLLVHPPALAPCAFQAPSRQEGSMERRYAPTRYYSPPNSPSPR
jgi:hypothetical protein